MSVEVAENAVESAMRVEVVESAVESAISVEVVLLRDVFSDSKIPNAVGIKKKM